MRHCRVARCRAWPAAVFVVITCCAAGGCLPRDQTFDLRLSDTARSREQTAQVFNSANAALVSADGKEVLTTIVGGNNLSRYRYLFNPGRHTLVVGPLSDHLDASVDARPGHTATLEVELQGGRQYTFATVRRPFADEGALFEVSLVPDGDGIVQPSGDRRLR